MYTLLDVPQEFVSLDQKAKSLIKELLESIPAKQKGVRILSEKNIFGDSTSRESFFVLTEGILSFSNGTKSLVFFDEGDLFGFTNHYNLENLKLSSEFAVVVDRYSSQEFLEVVRSSERLSSLWFEYLSIHLSLFTLIAGMVVKNEPDFHPMLRHFKRGDTIIKQDGDTTEVYSLVDGQLEVFVDGVKVGEVLKDEIFGVLAPLTGTKRTASVVASKSCTVLSLPKDRFIEIIQQRPETVLKMVGDMARSIVALNEKVRDMFISKLS